MFNGFTQIRCHCKYLAVFLFLLGMDDGSCADQANWVPYRSRLTDLSIQDDKLVQLSTTSIDAVILSELYPNDPDSVTRFHTLQSRAIPPDGKLTNGTACFLFNEPFVSGNRWTVYSSWIYPKYALFEVSKLGANPLLLSCSLTETPGMRKITKVEVKGDAGSNFAKVTDSDTEMFVYNDKESFLINFITGEIAARWPGVADIDLLTRKPSCSFCKKESVLTRVGTKGHSAFVHRTFVGDSKRNHVVELKSPNKENVFITYVKGDPAVVEFIWGAIKTEFYYCRLDSAEVVQKHKIEGLLTQQQRSVLVIGNLVRNGWKIYGCVHTKPDDLVNVPLPLQLDTK